MIINEETLRHMPRSTALHVAAATAVGALNLAVAANFHAPWITSGHRRLLVSALVAWPVLVAVPAFVIALIAATGLALTQRRA